MTVYSQQISPTVIVVVKELCPPPDVSQGCPRFFGRIRNISERVMAVVMEKRVVVVIEVCLEDRKPALVVVISDRHAHAPLLAAVLVDRRTGAESDLFERPVSVVVIQKR